VSEPEPDEPEHEPWPKHKYESQNQNFNGHWKMDGDYVSKTQACKEFNLSPKEFEAVLAKAEKEKLQLRTKILQNERYGNSFTVYSVDDLRHILGLSQRDAPSCHPSTDAPSIRR
jgi:hypothetical protein